MSNSNYNSILHHLTFDLEKYCNLKSGSAVTQCHRNRYHAS